MAAMRCPACWKRPRRSDRFCTDCGTPLPRPGPSARFMAVGAVGLAALIATLVLVAAAVGGH
jgi:hypothetical protein